jgi:SAM-dependent methyltransferase
VSGSLRDRWRLLRAWLSPSRTVELGRVIPEGSSVLDVGCGSHSQLVNLRDRLSRLTGIDAFPAALAEAQRRGAFDSLVEGRVQELDKLFDANAYDVVAAIDLLEHLDEEDGARLLEPMERVATGRVVVLTPNRFVPQGELDGNPWQVHRSGWSPRQFRLRGFTVRGMHGLRALRSEEAYIRFRPHRFWAVVSDFTAPVARVVPSLAYHLIATKDVR